MELDPQAEKHAVKTTRPDGFAQLREAFETRTWPGGGHVTVLDQVDSTSDWLQRLDWGRVEPGWAGCVARQQMAGRGRGGHQWASEADAGLWCSLRMPVVPAVSAQLPPLSLVLAGGVVRVLNDRGIGCGIKWPNDLWLNRAKVAGLLVEQVGPRRQRSWVVGLGLNWRAPRTVQNDERLPAYPVSGLNESGVAIDRLATATAIIERMVEIMQQPETWSDWMPVVDQAHVLTGRTVDVIEDGMAIRHGRVRAIADDGQLVLETSAGTLFRVGGAASVRLTD